eukprot:CAMPEP_0174248880 /NCGR_PEP_ID=MMETSP0417-20130205/43300_1 /TAXON_ID=242541 /ORGANISM="Mayorella sp, Strain BSH-02190019" /LENGTH=790 /DNA_ID=CAMNT_0015328747 /DNA_START=1 /DNA_END=2373 /DNA_ORIENTATION=-
MSATNPELAAALEAVGLTAYADKLAEDGLDSLATLREITLEDLLEYGVPKLKARSAVKKIADYQPSAAGVAASAAPVAGAGASSSSPVLRCDMTSFSWANKGEKWVESGNTRPMTMWAPEKEGVHDVQLIACESIGALKLWNTEFGQCVGDLRGSGIQYSDCVRSNDQDMVVGSGPAGVIQLWNGSTQAELNRWSSISGLSSHEFNSVSLMPSTGASDLQLCAMAMAESSIYLFDLAADGRMLACLNTPMLRGGGRVRTDLEKPGLVYVCPGYMDGKCYAFDVRAGNDKPVRTFLGQHGEGVAQPLSCTSTPGGAQRLLVSWCNDMVRLWDVGTGKSFACVDNDNGKRTFRYAGANSYAVMAMCREDGELHLWSLDKLSRASKGPTPPSDYSLISPPIKRNAWIVEAGAVSGLNIFMGTVGGIVHGFLGEPTAGDASGGAGEEQCGAVPPTFPPIADLGAVKWLHDGEKMPDSNHAKTMWAAQRPDQQVRFVSCHSPGKLEIWNTEHGQIQQTLLGEGDFNCPGVSTVDGIRAGDIDVICGSGDQGVVQVYDATHGKTLHRYTQIAGLERHLESISLFCSGSLSYLRMAAMCNEASAKANLRVFDLNRGIQTVKIQMPFLYFGLVKCNQADPSSQLVYVQSAVDAADQKVYVYDVRAPEAGAVRTLLGMNKAERPRKLTSAVTEKGQHLLCSSSRLEAVVWDMNTGDIVHRLETGGDDGFRFALINHSGLYTMYEKNHRFEARAHANPDKKCFIAPPAFLSRLFADVYTECISGTDVYIGTQHGIAHGKL